MLHGGCFCQNVRYTLEEGDYRVVDCHCSMCRKTSAAAYVTWVVVPRRAFEFTRGKPKLLKSSDQGARQFCADCGTPITFSESDRPDEIDVTCCSLDNPDDLPPTSEVHEDTKVLWLRHA